MATAGWLTWKRRASLATAALAGLSLLFASVWMASMSWRQPVPPTPPPPSPPPARTEVMAAAMRAGLHADALLAAGVGSQSFPSIVNGVRDYLTAHPGQMRSLDTQVDSARRAASPRARADAPNPQAGTTPDQALAARDAFYSAMFDAATTSLSQEQKAMLLAQKRNKGKSVPAKYLVIDRSDAEWVVLRDALADQAIASRDGRQAPDSVQQVIASADANAAVSSAGQRLSGDRTAMRTAWTQALQTATR